MKKSYYINKTKRFKSNLEVMIILYVKPRDTNVFPNR